jgi:hypothetical protein
MVRKEHFSNKAKKSKTDTMESTCIKFSQVVEPTATTPFEEYLFSSTREGNHKAADSDYDIVDNMPDGRQALLKDKDE